MNPLVTIAIPTYSRVHYLKEAVASALAQTHDPIEVLIGDDGRTESILEWGRALALQDRRVRYQRNERNLGLSGNFNALAEAAQGEFIVIIGDDDRLWPEFVSTMLAAVHSGAHVAFCNHYLIDSQGARLEAESREHTRRYHRDQLRAGWVAKPCQCAWQNAVPMTTALLRTADVRRLRFQEELNTPDIEFFIRLAQEGARFVFVPEYLAEYRVHPGSATGTGLRSEELAERLLPIQVTPELEPYKRDFLGPVLVNSVTRCLLRGERTRAGKFLASAYYPQPRWRHAAGLVQSVCLMLPSFVGRPLFTAAHRIKAALKW